MDTTALDPSVTPQIIVFASFVERPQTVAYLCRACESFCFNLLVVSSLEMAFDSFGKMPLSSRRNVKMQQIAADDATEYFASLKSSGTVDTVVALDHLDGGVSAASYSFPEKFCLVLGNEHHGIPKQVAEFIDVFVGVPQLGYVRLLSNTVHSAFTLQLQLFCTRSADSSVYFDCGKRTEAPHTKPRV